MQVVAKGILARPLFEPEITGDTALNAPLHSPPKPLPTMHLRTPAYFLLLLVTACLTMHARAKDSRLREATEWDTAYWYNANDNKLPRVLLLGDSICNGYQSMVRDELAGVAYVSFWATSKCVTDRSYLKQLTYILEEYPYVLVHFNNGLHSLGSNREDWEEGLRQALRLIREKSAGAHIIWASSTPLRDPLLTDKAIELNTIAARVMRAENIAVDDLFELMNPLDRAKFWTDTYHYTTDGKRLQARKVADVIRASLGTGKASAQDAAASLKAATSETGPDGKIGIGESK